jgi:hypothetical protein
MPLARLAVIAGSALVTLPPAAFPALLAARRPG